MTNEIEIIIYSVHVRTEVEEVLKIISVLPTKVTKHMGIPISKIRNYGECQFEMTVL